MKVSINWLKQYVDIEDIPVKELSDRLTLSGLEVEGVETTSKVSNVVTAKVESKEKHPNADKLNVCTVIDGAERFQVVCGAPNVGAGQIIAFARIGAELPAIKSKIKQAKIRGLDSFGMICSEFELGISDEHDGIMVLSPDTPLGVDINDILGLGDTVLELNVTPNRPDWLSIIGVAREVSAIFGRKLNLPDIALKESGEPASKIISVEVKEPAKCPIYTLRVIKGVKIAPSPLWMQIRLKSAGIRAINNVVDVTNYILLEYGQPLHAFDLSHISKGIIVRNASEGEDITTLDGKPRKLDSQMLVIADHSRPLAIAGVMGGEFSGVNNNTSDIALECAYFAPASVRRTSKKLTLSSDSSYRYERGIDHGATERLADYAAMLISEVCGGEVMGARVGGSFAKIEKSSVKSSVSGINRLLGTDIKAAEMAGILNSLSIKTAVDGDNMLSEAPTFRVDIVCEADIAEEVARIYGYDKIATTIPQIDSDPRLKSPEASASFNARHSLETYGFNEVVNFSFLGSEYLSLFDKPERFVKLLNPISADMAWMRTSLFPSILKNLQTNSNQNEPNIRIFEFGSGYVSNGADKLASERLKLAIGVMGSFMPLSWVKMPEISSFYYLRGVLDNILEGLGLKADYEPVVDICYLHPGKSAKVKVGGAELGFIGALHPDFIEKLDMKEECFIAEIDFKLACEISSAAKFSYSKFSRFPSAERDLSIIIPDNINAGDIVKSAAHFNPLITSVRIFDNYKGTGITEGFKSIAFRITFTDLTKTLNDDDIKPIIDDMLIALDKKFGAKLR